MAIFTVGLSLEDAEATVVARELGKAYDDTGGGCGRILGMIVIMVTLPKVMC